MFFKQKKSITVRSVNGDLYITNDKKFTGSNQCLYCDFYPCVINKWYGKNKKIEDCNLVEKLLNKPIDILNYALNYKK